MIGVRIQVTSASVKRARWLAGFGRLSLICPGRIRFNCYSSPLAGMINIRRLNGGFFSHFLSVVGRRPPSLISTGCGVPLKGDWAILCHIGSGLIGRVWSLRQEPLKYSHHGCEINQGHGEERLRDTFPLPLTCHDNVIKTIYTVVVSLLLAEWL